MKYYKRNMLARFSLLVCIALGLSGCANLRSDEREDLDDRFGRFSHYVPEELEVRTDVQPLSEKLPGLRISSAHWVSQARLRRREFLPEPDRPVWLHAVIRVDSDSAIALDEVAAGEEEGKLPPIYPSLHQYVPQDCSFLAVPAERAGEVSDVENAQLGTVEASFFIREIAVSKDCGIAVMTAETIYR